MLGYVSLVILLDYLESCLERCAALEECYVGSPEVVDDVAATLLWGFAEVYYLLESMIDAVGVDI